MIHGIKKNSIVFQIWRSFILFILLPVLLLNIAISYMLYDMENTTKEIVKNRMAHARRLLEQDITDSLATVNTIGSNYDIQKLSLIKGEMTPEGYGALFRIRQFGQLMAASSGAYSISLLFNGSNIFMSENSFCPDLSQFYHQSYEFGDVPMEQLKEYGHWGRNITFYPSAEVKLNMVDPDGIRTGIFYTMVLTPYAGEDTGATAIVFLDAENLQMIFGELDTWQGLTYIMDSEGQILYQAGNEGLVAASFPLEEETSQIRVLPEEVFGKDNFAVMTSIDTGLQIVSVIPERELFLQMGNLRIFIWLLNGTTLIMCLSLSLMLARKRSRILSGTLELMDHEEEDSGNVFSEIYRSVSRMVDANASLESALGEQKEMLRTVFWSRILNVNSMSDIEIKRLAESAGIRADAPGYCLLLLGFGSETEMEAGYWNQLLQRRKAVLEKMEECQNPPGFIGSAGVDQVVLLFPLSREECEDYQNVVAEKVASLELMKEKESMQLCVGSTLFSSLRDIYSAYTMCGRQLNLSSNYPEPRGIIWCQEEDFGTEAAFYYTDELKSQLVLWIKTGQQQLVRDGFQKILEENYLKRRISGAMELLLIAKLKMTLLGAYDSRMAINLAEVFEHIDKIQTDAWRFSYILRVAMDMCGHYMANIRSHEEGLQKKITAFVDEHFMEYGFGLSVAAEHCNFSEAYFSQIFKEIIGENFSSYVEKKRMAYAYQLIVETGMTIDAVAEKTGYSNTNAFRKAYKRFYGISPSQSRRKPDQEK